MAKVADFKKIIYVCMCVSVCEGFSRNRNNSMTIKYSDTIQHIAHHQVHGGKHLRFVREMFKCVNASSRRRFVMVMPWRYTGYAELSLSTIAEPCSRLNSLSLSLSLSHLSCSGCFCCCHQLQHLPCLLCIMHTHVFS